MIIQNEPISPEHRAELSFTLPKSDLASAKRTLDGLADELKLGSVIADEDMGTVSLIGAGMRSHPGVAAKVFQTLGEQKINIEMITTSPIKISCAIRADRVADAVRSLHTAFELDGAGK
jgi:aspartate kinase